jgi:hypothetical protein
MGKTKSFRCNSPKANGKKKTSVSFVANHQQNTQKQYPRSSIRLARSIDNPVNLSLQFMLMIDPMATNYITPGQI